MKLYDQIARAFLAAVNEAASDDWDVAGGIGSTGSIDFFTSGGSALLNTGTTGASIDSVRMLGTGAARIAFSSTPLQDITGVGILGTRAIGTFDIQATTAVVANAGVAAYFAILNSTATTGLTLGNVVLTGTVSTNAGSGDIRFNITDWAAGDQVSITSLTFVQPK